LTEFLPHDIRGVVPASLPRFIYQPICCTRYVVLQSLLSQLNQDSLIMLEIGVHRAIVAEHLLSRIPHLQYVGVDPYMPPWHDHIYEEALSRLQPYGHRARILRQESSLAWNSSGDIASIGLESLDLLFVDGDHSFESALKDVQSWSRLVRPGGIVAGHDFLNPGRHGVADAVLRLRGPEDEVNLASDYTFWWTKD